MQEPRWRNRKHGQQWGNTLGTYAYPVTREVRMGDIDTAMIVRILQPIWTKKANRAPGARPHQDYPRCGDRPGSPHWQQPGAVRRSSASLGRPLRVALCERAVVIESTSRCSTRDAPPSSRGPDNRTSPWASRRTRVSASRPACLLYAWLLATVGVATVLVGIYFFFARLPFLPEDGNCGGGGGRRSFDRRGERWQRFGRLRTPTIPSR
ncbi:phage integrase central domain-containing protein [Paraburkholderia atlantica]|uniref:phage integrase central domain-containing protein n=2 Tax=Paraburkholderia atlantica TaxID=2654982 RepID=UPI0035D4AA2A